MSIEVIPYTAEWEKAVVLFNLRLRRKDVTFQFPTSSIPIWLPRIGNRRLYQEFFLALEDHSVVRGGYILKHHDVSLSGRITDVCGYQLPLSEGVADRAYKEIGGYLLRDAIQRQPLLFALGMGGLNKPMPTALKRRDWSLRQVPFHFRVIHPSVFFRNIKVLRTSRARATALDLLANSGIGWMAVKAYQAAHPVRAAVRATARVEGISSFDSWADNIWNRTKGNYRLATSRDSETLNILYPECNKRFIRLRLLEGEQAVGWIVGLNTKMTGHKQFGNMRVGSIIDCLALPDYERDMVAAITKFLLDGKVDIIVANQSYAPWCTALRKSGFMQGPSNFVLAVSPELARILGPLERSMPAIHINRGDGGGPINL